MNNKRNTILTSKTHALWTAILLLTSTLSFASRHTETDKQPSQIETLPSEYTPPLPPNGATAQLWTDFGGFWTSSDLSPNATQPDNSHKLLAFLYNGTIYSTGVNDNTLNSNNVTFTPGNWRALPITSVASGSCPPPSSDAYLVMLGQLYDGVDDGGSTPAPFETELNGCASPETLSAFLTDGTRGLDIGTGLANIPAGTSLTFTFSTNGITLANIADGVPDILITQLASPGGTQDELAILDGSGNIVGNVIDINQSNTTSIGTWRADFYYRNGDIRNDGGVTANGERDIRYLTFQLSDFGIDGTNYQQAVSLRWTASGSSDPAFFAFNEPSISIPTQVTILNPANQASSVESGYAITPSYEVAIQDNQGLTVQEAGQVITASIYQGTGSLQGTLSATTNASGIATFSDLKIIGYGNHILQFSYSSLTPATSAIVTVNCQNPSDGGTIGSAQSLCSGVTPALLVESQAPGGTIQGIIEYQWQSSTTSAIAGFADIPGATAASYQPGLLNQTTWFIRKIKVTCSPTWLASNTIEITMNPLLQYQSKNGLDYTSARNWSTMGNWEQFNGTSWIDASSYPGEINNACPDPITTIQSTHRMEINPNDHIQISNLSIEGNGKLWIKSGAKLFVQDQLQLEQQAGASIELEGNVGP